MKPMLKDLSLSIYIIRRNKLALLGLAIILIFVFISLFGRYITPYDAFIHDLDERFQPPSIKHLFGTDEFGRDILSRLMYGAGYSVGIGVTVLTIAAPLGCVLGATSGYFGGKYDEILMRITDVFLAFPGLVLALAISAALGPSLVNTMFALTVVWWPGYARLVRGQALSLREEAYTEAAKSMGAGHLYIIMRHILPNCISTIIVAIAMDMSHVMLLASGLSFLGFGAQPPLPEWGRMIAEGRIYVLRAWWITAFPGLAIFLMVLGFNIFGDALRDILDPKTRRVIEVRENE